MDTNSTNQTSPETNNQSTEASSSTSEMCVDYDSKKKRTEKALGLYEGSYSGLKNGQQMIGAMIDTDGLHVAKEEGPDANSPDGLVLETREDGDVLLTLIQYDNSALSLMQNSRFHDALEEFQNAKSFLETNLVATSTDWERSDGGWEYTKKFASQCDIENADLFPQPINNGISSVNHLIDAAAKFEEECKVYLDNNAEFEDNVPEADQLQQEAISDLQSAANNYPRTPESLEDQVLVYRSE